MPLERFKLLYRFCSAEFAAHGVYTTHCLVAHGIRGVKNPNPSLFLQRAQKTLNLVTNKPHHTVSVKHYHLNENCTEFPHAWNEEVDK